MKTDISLASACQTCVEFMKLVGLPAPKTGELRGTLGDSPKWGRFWSVVARGYRLEVDARTGRVWELDKAGWFNGRFKGKLKKGPPWFKEPEEDRVFARAVVAKLGVPKDAAITSWWYRHGDEYDGRMSADEFGAVFSKSGKQVASLEYDIRGLTPIRIDMNPERYNDRSTVVSVAPPRALPTDLTFAAACAKAVAFEKTLGMPPDDPAHMRGWLSTRFQPTARCWAVIGRRYNLDVDARNGLVYSFVNESRMGLRGLQRVPPGANKRSRVTPRFPDLEVAKAYILDYAARLGVPSDSKVDWCFRRSPFVSVDPNLQFGATFNRNNRTGSVLLFWAEDGQPLDFQFEDHGVAGAVASAPESAKIHEPKPLLPPTKINEKTAQKAAESFLARAMPGLDRAELYWMDVRPEWYRGAPWVRWSASTPHYSVTIDDFTGQVTMFTDERREMLAMPGPGSREGLRSGRPFYRSEQDVVAKAAAALDRLGWSHGPDVQHRPRPQPNASGEIGRTIISVEFDDRPNGYPANGYGNSCTVGLDSLTGDLVEARRLVGYTYAPANVKITKDQALAIAARAIKLTSPPDVHGPQYQGLSLYSRAISPEGRKMAENRMVPLVYAVRGVSEDVYIDVSNGKILTRFSNAVGGAARKGPSSGRTSRRRPDPKPRALDPRGRVSQRPRLSSEGWLSLGPSCFWFLVRPDGRERTRGGSATSRAGHSANKFAHSIPNAKLQT
ncbi:MAG: hypothetical protein ACHQ50_07625 [Fimbriimonadales bacterium]